MKRDFKENSILFTVGIDPPVIFEAFQKLGIRQIFVCHTISRYINTSFVETHIRLDRPHSVGTTKDVIALKGSNHQEPISKQKRVGLKGNSHNGERETCYAC